MATKNSITGDKIKSKPNSNKYRDNWDIIFNKSEKKQNVRKTNRV